MTKGISNLKASLAPHAEGISARWLEAVNGTYPFNTVGFLRTNANPFINPVGERNKAAAAVFTSCILDNEPNMEAVHKAMQDFIKVRAVQEFSPEDAIGIIFAFKSILREAAATNKLPEASATDWRILDGAVDALVLVAATAYSKAREEIALLRVDEIKRRHAQVIRQAQKMMNEDFSDLLPEKKKR